jgi:soluble lytic murein transglycosylase-like protein
MCPVLAYPGFPMPRHSSALLRPLRTPSRPFLTFLAASGFVAGLLLTPSANLETTPMRGLVSPRSKATSTVPADSATLEREVVARYDHLPLAQIFSRRADPEIANRAARAIVKESRQLQIAPSLLAGVLITENARLEPESVSHKGAIGLMQVMRFHAGVFDCDSDDLRQVEANICHGSRVFAGYLKRTKDVRSALLRYNGCIRSLATQSCRRYPTKVLREAELVRQQLLLYLPRQRLRAASAGASPIPAS